MDSITEYLLMTLGALMLGYAGIEFAGRMAAQVFAALSMMLAGGTA